MIKLRNHIRVINIRDFIYLQAQFGPFYRLVVTHFHPTTDFLWVFCEVYDLKGVFLQRHWGFLRTHAVLTFVKEYVLISVTFFNIEDFLKDKYSQNPL